MVRRALIWSSLSQIANFAIQFATSIVMARLLSPIEMGVYAIAWSVIGVVQVFTGFSVATYLVREEKLQPYTLDTAFTINAFLSLTLALLILTCSFAAVPLLREPRVGQVLQLLVFLPLLGIPSFRASAMLQRRMQLRGVSIVGTLSALSASAVSVGAAMAARGALSPAYGALAGALLGMVGTMYVGREHNSLRMSLHDWRPMSAFGLRLMSIGGISTAAVRMSDFILGRMLGLATLGVYNRAGTLNSLLFTNVYGTATRLVFARLSAARRDGGEIQEVFIKGFRLVTGIMGPLLLGLAVLGGPVIHTLYGEKWLEAGLPFSLLMLGQFVTLSFAMNWELFVLRDEMKTQTRLELARSATGVASQIAACFIDLTAVAASSIFDSLMGLCLYRRHMVRLIGCHEGRLWRVYAEVLGLSLVATLPSFVLMLGVGWSPRVPLVAVGAAVLAGGVMWALALRSRDHPLVGEAAMVLNRAGLSRLKLGQAVS